MEISSQLSALAALLVLLLVHRSKRAAAACFVHRMTFSVELRNLHDRLGRIELR